MKNTKEYYYLANQYWNRRKLDDAKYYFDKTLKNIEVFDEYEKTNIVKFYMHIKNKEISIQILKEMIYKYENIVFAVESYIDLNEENISIEELKTIDNISILKNNMPIKYKIAKAFYIKGKYLKSYELIVAIIDYIEKDKQVLEQNFDIYIDSILLIIELEYKFENYVQARFQIRKIINGNLNINNKIEIIIYWAIMLDVLNEFIVDELWMDRIKTIQHKELKVLTHVLIKIYKQSVTLSTYKLLINNVFENKNLKEKASVLAAYIEKCMGKETWSKKIDNIDIKKHLLGLIMYFEKNKDSVYFDSKDFLEKYFVFHCDRHQVINTYWNLNKKKDEKNIQEKEEVLKDITIKFIGGADKIGGSCILIKYKNTNILLDAGANIGEAYYPNFDVLEEEGMSIKDIDYLIISHAHLDHIGSLPYIYKENSDIKIISTPETKEIMKIMLDDIIRTNKSENVQVDITDIRNSVSSVITKSFNSNIKLNKDISLKLYKAGHILGASCIELNINGVNILYTGDYCVHEQYTVPGMDLPKDINVDVLITESTYAYTPNNFNLNKPNQEKLFIEDIMEVINRDGVALIPAFAVGRAQELILTLKNHFKEENFLPFDLYVDGKVVDVCDLYQKYITKQEIYGNGVSTVNSRYKEVNEANISKFKGSCIIASSGMLNQNSRSSKYANAIVEDENSAIFFSGYLDEESPGRNLLNKIQTEICPHITIEGTTREVRCSVKSYKLSAHIKKYELLQMILKLNPKYIFMVHGDTTNKYKYFGDENIGETIYPTIESFTQYIKDINIIKPVNGESYKCEGF